VHNCIVEDAVMDYELLKPSEVSLLLRWQERRLLRLAKLGQIPHIVLPDGEIRFEKSEIDRLIEQGRRRATNE
jgi:predicted site-specific integrase-resolvase